MNPNYVFYITCPNARPVFWAIPAFLWGQGCNFDSDGDAVPADSTTWTDLYARLRTATTDDWIDISLVQEEPLLLEVVSPKAELAVRTAYILAHYTDGKIARHEDGDYENAQSHIDELGVDFDLEAAMREFQKALHGADNSQPHT